MTSEFSPVSVKKLDFLIIGNFIGSDKKTKYERLRHEFHVLTKDYKFQDVAELMSALLCTYTCRKPTADQIMTVYSVIKDMLELVALYGIEQSQWRSSDDMEAYIDQFKPVLRAFFDSCAPSSEDTPGASRASPFLYNGKEDKDQKAKHAFHNLNTAWKDYITLHKGVDVPTAVFKLYLHAIDWNKEEHKECSAMYAIDLFTEQYFRALMESGVKPDPIDDLGNIRRCVESVFKRCYAKFYKE